VKSGSASFANESGINGACYSKTSWFITPKKAGAFRVTKEFFRDFPEDIAAPDLTVLVKEK
jgi:hypothetical protein